MATNKIHKFKDIVEAELFLNGAIIGGMAPVPYLPVVGKKLHFIAPGPVANVTFVAGANPAGLTFAEFKTQVEAGAATVKVRQYGGKIVLLATGGQVVLHPVDAADANGILGFDPVADVAGKTYQPAAVSATAPCWTWSNTDNNNTHVIYTWE